MKDQPAERTILRRAQAGDLDAFELLIRQHERQVMGLCYHMLGSMEDAKNASQDVLLKLYAQLGRFDYERQFTPWLLCVVMNVCRDQLRRRRPAEPVDNFELLAVGRDPEATARFSEEWTMMLAAIASLPEQERVALQLPELEELSGAEVAARLRVTEETVRSQVSKAKAKLKYLMGRMMRRKR